MDLAVRVAAARALLRSAWPEAVERETARGAGRTFLYTPSDGGSAGGSAAVLRLVVDAPNLLLHVAEGARLPDPAGLLRGEGRRGRYVCLGAVASGDEPALRALIAVAAAGAAATSEIDIDHKPGATA
ncbi:hypothetical protein [Sphingomonas sp. R1]|uniref:hypothetical protein n=1 Tax=Sphingomonas sp. R1 TaxID=399176 RepID=UPI002225253C|nr:hypothetical protein [Sphingomonas sp. R1]UYY78122.1 hypothetical protein OIM94_03715 [Sphingomonas sp. R1]